MAFLHRGHTGDVMDDGLYFVTAQSLSAGRGYTLPSQPGPPIRCRYPSGLPGLIGLALRVAPGRDLAAARAVVGASGWVFALAAFAWLRRSGASGLAAALAVLAAMFHPTTVMHAIAVMSDVPFAAVVAVALLLATFPTGGPARGFVHGLVAGAGVALRGVGVTLIPGAILAAVRGPESGRRRLAAAVACGLGVLAVVAPARRLALWGNGGRTDGGYGQELAAGYGSVGEGAAVVASHLGAMARELPRVVLAPLDSQAASARPAAAWAVAAAVLVVTLTGAARLARSGGARQPSAWSYVASVVAVFAVWPGPFSNRFVISLVPAAVWAFGVGTAWVARRLGAGRRLARRAGVLAMAAALAGNVGFMGRVAVQAARQGGLWGDPAEVVDLDAALGFVRSGLEADAVVVSMTPEMVYLATGRQGLMLIWEDDKMRSRFGRLERLAARVAEAPGRPVYLMGPPPDPSGPPEARQTDALARHPGLAVEPVYRSPGGRYWLARVAWKGEP